MEAVVAEKEVCEGDREDVGDQRDADADEVMCTRNCKGW